MVALLRKEFFEKVDFEKQIETDKRIMFNWFYYMLYKTRYTLHLSHTFDFTYASMPSYLVGLDARLPLLFYCYFCKQ